MIIIVLYLEYVIVPTGKRSCLEETIISNKSQGFYPVINVKCIIDVFTSKRDCSNDK